MTAQEKVNLEGLGRDEVRAVLRKKGRLTLAEAALFIGWAPNTLYNRIAMLLDDPLAAPRGVKRGKSKNSRYEFRVADIEAWERATQEKVGA